MSSWAGNRSFAPQKKPKAGITYFQPTEGGICSNFNLLFSAYMLAVKNSESLYVVDHPNCISKIFPLFQTILKENSTVKYVKDLPEGSKRLSFSDLNNNQLLHSTSQAILKRNIRDLLFYNGETQEKIMSTIRGAGLERTPFDVGVHIRSGDKITTGEMKSIPISTYVNALSAFANRIGKSKLNIYVMTDNMKLFDELKRSSPTTWNFITLQTASSYTANGHNQDTFNALPEDVKLQQFYLFLTELHILQNTPNLVVSFSSNVGRFLYISSRFAHSSDTVISVDVPKWSLF